MTRKSTSCRLKEIQLKSAGKTTKPSKMATSAFDVEIERFIKPIHGLYKEYVTTIDEFLAKNEEMMEDRIIISDLIRDGFLVYELFGDGEDGEIIWEKVQTWICDNRMEVTNAVSTMLRAKKITFGDWFRSSEANRSPDELIIYCLAKMSKRHTVIFNKSFPWSTLVNYISYTDSEIVERSTVLLIYVGVLNYAIIQLKPKIPYDIGKPASTKKGRKSTKKRTPTKTTCRSSTRKVTSNTKKSTEVKTRTQPVRSRSRTLSEQRHDRYGIGNASSSVNSRTRQKKVDYLKLNDGLEDPPETTMSPKPKWHRNHLPSRSGPSSRRQKAQKIVTSPPVQVLATLSSHQKTNSTVDEISGVQPPDSDNQNLLPNVVSSILQEDFNNTTNKPSELSGIHVPDGNSQDQTQLDVSGIQETVSGVRNIFLTKAPETNSDTITSLTQEENSTNVPPVHPVDTDTLPDLVINSGNTDCDLTANLHDCNRIPPIGDTPPEHLFDGATTEEEFDVVNALLSLSTVRTNTYEDNDDNSSLMLIVGSPRFVDVNPVPVQLDQTTVDGAIAQIVEEEQNNAAIINDPKNQTVPHKERANSKEQTTEVPPVTIEETDEKNQPDSTNNYDDETELDDSDNEQPRKGYVKLTTHGIKKKSSTDGRSYRCTVCGKSKRSARHLNIHHRRNHSAQMCGICGKIFELASSLTHHMYSHDERQYHCDKCSFHSHFESELKKHKITHHTNPQHQCMHHKCGCWFRRKSDLVLHVETHKKNVIKCKVCDHTTTLPKYMKEHMKSHENKLPYQCNICNKRFLW